MNLERTAADYFERGNDAYNRGDLEQAYHSYQTCLAKDSQRHFARYNLAVVLGELGLWERAIEELQALLDSGQDTANVHNRLGFSASHLDRADPAIGQTARSQTAIHHYERAIELAPDFALAHFNLSIELLRNGDFDRGFAEYEWRWRTDEFTPFECPQPRWHGEDIADKTLLVHTEQGAGDSIQFARFLSLAKQKCDRLLLCCPAHLQRLFVPIAAIDRLLLPGTIALSAFDTYIPLMSLPHTLGTTLATLPRASGLNAADYPAAVAQPERDRPAIGIVWAGSPTQTNDRARSCKLQDFLPLLTRNDCDFFSLQVGDRAADLSQLPKEIADDIHVTDLSPTLRDYADTAAAIAALDLVVSVDTSVAHLAAALGKPVWTLLCHRSDWRWLRDREDTPWYPTMRLFRQTQPGDWDGVFAQVAIALDEFVAVSR